VNNYSSSDIKVKFSIPGRIRLKIALLYKNKFLAQKLSQSIKSISNITSVDFNANNSNLLIIYNHEKLSEKELKAYIETYFTEFRPIQNNENNSIITSIYESEKAISKRITLISTILIGMASIGNFNVATIISIMILVSPFILFHIRNMGYKLTSHLLLERQVNLQNNSIIKILSEVDEVFIKDNLIINKNVVKHYTNLLEKDCLSVQKHVIYGDLKEPIFFNSKILVNNLRNIGINKIYIVSKEKSKFIDYAKTTLGINSLIIEDGCTTKCINDFSEEPLIFVVGRSNNKNEISQSSVIYVCTEIDEVKYKDELLCILRKRDILILPYSILLSKHMENKIKTIESISLSINMIGILFVMSKLIFVRGSLVVYFFNLIFSTCLLNKDLNKSDSMIFESLK